VIGLGVGTLAAYGRPGDVVHFFEIDPGVIRLARDERYFSYLTQSAAEIEIVEGDARISLARERAQDAPRFDYLIVDAYSSDAVPVHLLTREALALYLDSLHENGLLAIHTSSRYFDLFPVLARLASDAGLHVVALGNPAAPKHQTFGSNWVMMARDAARIRSLARAAQQRHRALGLRPNAQTVRFATPAVIAGSPLWTDDYSNLYRAISRRPAPAR
jgi:spermidine synthase